MAFNKLKPHLADIKSIFFRADREAYSKRIIEHNVLNGIDKSEILVADISPEEKSGVPNPSVMHEIGYAVGRDIPVILIGKNGSHEKSPANLRGSILIDYDFEKMDKFIGELSDQIEKTLKDYLIENIRGDYSVQCFTERDSIGIYELVENSSRRVQIITT
jgi:nucleoside 2-deoxyribosyltransferase